MSEGGCVSNVKTNGGRVKTRACKGRVATGTFSNGKKRGRGVVGERKGGV